MINRKKGFLFPLDPMQRPAVEAPEGVSVVIGGTGTGKSHVLIGRVAYLLDQGVDPSHMTCLAVRGEAAAELLRRLACHPRIRNCIDEIFVGTLHGYANFFLRRAGARVLGRSPDYTIWDRHRAVDAVQVAWADLHKANLKRGIIEEVLDWHWRNRGRPPFDPPYHAKDDFWEDVEEVYKEEKLRQRGVDHVDLLVMTAGAMNKDPRVRDEWRSTRTRHLLVDQVEDLNFQCLSLLELMVGPTRSLMVTADPNQATHDHPTDAIEILHLNHRDRKQHILRLDQVSSKELGEVMSTLQRAAGNDKGLWDYGQVADEVAEGAPVLTEVEGTLRDLYTHCLDEAQRLAGQGIPWEDMAILYRGGKVHLRLATQLVHRDIPYWVLGNVRTERPGDARLVVALLTCLLNPWDLHSFRISATPGHPTRQRILNVPSSLRLGQRARHSDVHLVEAARKDPEVLNDGDGDHRGLSWLVRVWEDLNRELGDPRCSLRDLLLLAQQRVREVQPPGLSLVEDPEMDVLRRLCAATPRVRGETPAMHLQRFLDRWSLGLHDRDYGPVQERGLTLSPIHAAKGQRWPVVFVLDVSDQTMPGKNVTDYSDRLHRERRIFYTAVTRATRLLYLYCLADTGMGADVTPTRFLDPIIHLMERRSVGIREVWAGN